MSHFHPRKSIRLHDAGRRGFSLTEILVATVILSLLALVLSSIAGQVGRIWQQGETGNDQRQRARVALNYIGRELRKATLPLNRSSQTSLRFEINPSTAHNLNFDSPHSLFWQAPIASDTSLGRNAEVGYFVYWNSSNKPALYRLFRNPSDSSYSPANPNDALKNLPTNWEEKYLFLENILGMWVKAYDKNGTVLSSSPYDSRLTHNLPAMVEISLVLLDANRAKRLTAPIDSQGMATADAYVAALSDSIRPGASVVSIKVSLDNAIGW